MYLNGSKYITNAYIHIYSNSRALEKIKQENKPSLLLFEKKNKIKKTKRQREKADCGLDLKTWYSVITK